MKHLRLFLLLTFAVLAAASLSAQQQLVRLTRYEGDRITGVSVGGSFTVELIHTPERAQNRAVVELDAELEPYLRFNRIADGTIEVSLNVPEAERRRLERLYRDFWRNRTARLTIYLGELNKVELSGSANIRSTGTRVFPGGTIRVATRGSGSVHDLRVDGERLEVSCTGSGRIELAVENTASTQVSVAGSGFVALTGSTQQAEFSVSGSGRIVSDEFRVRQATVRISGSGSIRFYAEESVTGSVAGSGSVRYGGNPTRVSVSKSGSGSIRPL